MFYSVREQFVLYYFSAPFSLLVELASLIFFYFYYHLLYTALAEVTLLGVFYSSSETATLAQGQPLTIYPPSCHTFKKYFDCKTTEMRSSVCNLPRPPFGSA